MEDLNTNIMNLMFNIHDFQIHQNSIMANMPDKDACGFPFEPFDSFSTEPLSFLEKAMMIQTEAVEMFKLIRTLNRHSPTFYQMSSDMEKLVSQLGSACITKAVIEQQGQNSADMDRLLGSLTIERLRGWTAFNLRKCFSAFMEASSNLVYNKPAVNLSIRWALLDKRLSATAEKIEQIKAGKVKVDLSDPAEAVKKAADAVDGKAEKPEMNAVPMSDSGRSLPVDKAAVRKILSPEQKPSGETEAAADLMENIMPEQAELAEASYVDRYEEEEDEELPAVSEALVQKMSEIFGSSESVKWALPEYAELSP